MVSALEWQRQAEERFYRVDVEKVEKYYQRNHITKKEKLNKIFLDLLFVKIKLQARGFYFG
jgi:hypothetical protein